MSDLGRPGPASGDTIWELRNPDGGSQGLEFAKARMGDHRVVLVHVAPSRLDVAVRGVDEVLLAIGTDLRAPGETPDHSAWRWTIELSNSV